jgi:glycosyltransferase involved in cell wall biosynthesis
VTDPVLWFVVPEGVDDPARVSGGNVFDLRVADGLRGLGWDVRLVESGADASSPAALATVPSDGLALVDGLVAIRAPEAIERARGRVRLALLVHMVAGAFADADVEALAAERRALACADLVLATSAWARDELVARGLVAPERVAVAPPGTDDAPLAEGTASRASLLCVGAVAPHKGQDVLVDALAALGPGWTCTIAGSVAVDPAFARRVADRAADLGVSDRIRWAGAVGRRELDALYDRADVLVEPSRTESFGMAVADALRRGIPVIATRVGGIPEAVDPGRAAILVSPGRPAALREALRRWMTEPGLRDALTAEARREGPHRADWSDTAVRVDRALRGLR